MAANLRAVTDTLMPPLDGLGMPAPPEGDGDNITDWALDQFHQAYEDPSISKDDVWEYLYGVMHAPDWRQTYKADLRRSLPRVPLAADFETFAKAGRDLLDLHLNYETGPEWLGVSLVVDGQPLEIGGDGAPTDPPDPTVWRIEKQMFWADTDGYRLRSQSTYDVTVDRLHINPRAALGGLPVEAGRDGYQVSGRTPLEWAAAVLRNEVDKTSGIHSDPNTWDAWTDNPFNLVRHLRRLVHLSVRSTEIIGCLPPSLDGPPVPAFETGLPDTGLPHVPAAVAETERKRESRG